MDIYFATNRDLTGDPKKPFGIRFHQDGPQYFRVGKAQVSRVANNGDDDDFKVDLITISDEKEAVPNVEEERLGSTETFKELKRLMRQEDREALTYIHGYASEFELGLARAALLKEQYLIRRKQPHVFMFSWPSDGKVFANYKSDREDAAASGLAIARALMRLLEFLRSEKGEGQEACHHPIHLVAHSMGNWALRHTVQAFRQMSNTDRLPHLFENVFLMAADEDDDALEHDHKLGLLPRLSSAVHVYHSRSDRVLTISDLTKGNPDRLGSDGPRNLNILDAKIHVVDCQQVDWTDIEHGRHQYYRLRDEVISDVRQVLAGTPPDKIKDREVIIGGRSYRIKGSKK